LNAEIVVVGTELLLGQTLDTNSQWLGRRLADLGINVYFRTTVGDNERRIAEVLRAALSRADLVLVCGGLGPTVDDVTRQGCAAATGRTLVLHDDLLAKIRDRFEKRGMRMTDNNALQAMVPQGGTPIPNAHGTAPGLWMDLGAKVLCAMPGVPREMTEMFDGWVVPALRERGAVTATTRSRVLHVVGMPESHLDTKIEDLFRSSENPTIGVLAHAGQVDVRLTARAANAEAADALIAPLERALLDRLADSVFGFDADTLEDTIGKNLMARGHRLAVAESLTGGQVCDRLTNVPGSSDWFERGVVAYSNASKTALLDVPEELFRDHGAVSEACARAMAEGVRTRSHSAWGLSLTGIAGPAGATPEKPVGLVFVALAGPRGTAAHRHLFPGDRAAVKRWASQAALTFLWRTLTQGA